MSLQHDVKRWPEEVGYRAIHCQRDDFYILDPIDPDEGKTVGRAIISKRGFDAIAAVRGEVERLTELADERFAEIQRAQGIIDEARKWREKAICWAGDSFVDFEAAIQRAETSEASLRSLRDALEKEWIPISEAPKTGEHIIAARFDDDGIGFGFCGGKKQPMTLVVHWWNHPGEEGWYPSMGIDAAFSSFTHWIPIPPDPKDY